MTYRHFPLSLMPVLNVHWIYSLAETLVSWVHCHIPLMVLYWSSWYTRSQFSATTANPKKDETPVYSYRSSPIPNSNSCLFTNKFLFTYYVSHSFISFVFLVIADRSQKILRIPRMNRTFYRKKSSKTETFRVGFVSEFLLGLRACLYCLF